MKRINSFLLVFLMGIFFLPGCVHYNLVSSKGTVKVGEALRVDPQIDWNVSDHNNLITWTVDGPFLQKINFFPGVKPGNPLIKPMPSSDKKMPVFVNDMTSLDVIDLVEATLSRGNANNFQRGKLTPAQFGNEDGFKFTYSFLSEAGLDYKGVAIGAIKDEKLYLILYTGTKLHYFDRYISEVEALVGSVQIM